MAANGVGALAVLDRWSRIGVPDFGGDFEKARAANALNIVLMGLMALTLINAAAIATASPARSIAVTVLMALVALVVASHQLMRRGHVRLASRIVVIGAWMIFSVRIALSGGYRSPGMLAYAFLCTIAGLLLGWRAAFAALVACGLALFGFVGAEAAGYQLPIVMLASPGIILASYTTSLLVFAGMLALAWTRQTMDESVSAELQFRRVIEQALDGVYVTDADGHILMANAALSDMLGYTREEFVALQAGATYLPEEQDILTDRLRRLAAGERLRYERTARRKDGGTIPVEVTASRLRDGRLHAILRDISDRKHASDALLESEDHFRLLGEAGFEGIGVSENGRVVDSNSRLAEMLGYQPHEMIGMAVTDLVAPEHRDRVLAHVRSGSPEAYEHLAARKDGTTLPVEVRGRTMPFHGRSVRVTAIRDLTDRYRSEEALRRSEDQFRVMFEGVSDVIFSISPEGVLSALNAAFEGITGWSREEWLGKPFSGLLHPGDQEKAVSLLQSVLLDQPREISQLRIRRQRGDYVIGEFHTNAQRRDGTVVAVIGIVRDITERVSLEERLRQSQKMEAVGQLAGGVAHDFNNLMTVIGSHAALLDGVDSTSQEQRDSLAEIRDAVDRAASLTRQLLTFSRQQVLQPANIDVNVCVAGLMKMLRRLLGEQVGLDVRYAQRPLPVHADPRMVDQVLINLAVNARDAMPDGGRISITTSMEEVDAAAAKRMAQAREGSFVCLTVSDTGSGISPEVLPRVFEPFFTTKGVGKGTGLGLATVHGIVLQHLGWVAVDSVVGRGTTFRIFLPRVAEAGPVASVPPGADAGVTHSATILIAEDEPALRDVMRRGLARAGYRVLSAPTGAAAMTAWDQEHGRIDLLITDIVMPDGITGWDLARELRARRPDLRIICMSGYSAGVPGPSDDAREHFTFLQKPFSLDALTQAVRAALDAN